MWELRALRALRCLVKELPSQVLIAYLQMWRPASRSYAQAPLSSRQALGWLLPAATSFLRVRRGRWSVVSPTMGGGQLKGYRRERPLEASWAATRAYTAAKRE